MKKTFGQVLHKETIVETIYRKRVLFFVFILIILITVDIFLITNFFKVINTISF